MPYYQYFCIINKYYQSDHTIIRLLLFIILFVNNNNVKQNKEKVVRVQNPVVETNFGTIEGLPATDGDYSMFMGIPYATVNASNPFGEAIPNPTFETTFQAFDDTAICPQIEEYFNNRIVGSLDCLHVNIYVPNSVQNSSTALPVFVYIYGGRFVIGYHGRFLYGPKFIVRHDVIMVTLSYRVGPYGFMCLNIPEVPGNQGLKDQQLALKWIKDNINAFGGNPDQITIAGESSGATSVDLLLYSPKEKLYKNVIMQSGHAIYQETFTDPDPDIPLRMTNYLGIQVNGVYEAIAALSSVDPHLLIEAAFNINASFKPCLESVFQGVEPFMTDHPLNIDLTAKVKGMPMLVGCTNNENILLTDSYPVEYFENPVDFINRVPTLFNLDDDLLNKLIDIVTNFYIGSDFEAQTKMWNVIDFISDINFYHPAERSIRKYLESGAEKVYRYVFSYTGKRNFGKLRFNVTVGGAAHSDDLGYLFDMTYMGTPSESDQLVIDMMTAMWTNFVKYDDPTPELSVLLPVKWEPVINGSSHLYMDIDSTLNLRKKPFHDRMAFWDLVYSAYKEYQPGYRGSN